MGKVTLPGDNWALLRPADEVLERHARPLRQLQQRFALSNAAGAFLGLTDSERQALTEREMFDRMKAAGASADDLDMLDRINDLLIEAFVKEWSFDAPVSAEGLLDLPGQARAALVAECEKAAGPLLSGDTSDEDVLDDDSPTPAASV
jgi:hypothetical protein